MVQIPPGILAWSAVAFVKSTVAGAKPEYTAAEATKHIGKKATGTDKCDFS